MKFRQALSPRTFPGQSGQPITLHEIELSPPGKKSVTVNVPADVHTRVSATLKDGDTVELIATAYEWDRKTKIAIADVRKVN